jgi:4-hydroxy-tetrahydrodipicolinate reductase
MKAIVVGALGRMGVQVAEALTRGGHTVAAYVDIGYGENIGNRYASIDAVPAEADVIIDFSFHLGTPAVVAYAAANGIPAVIATTGHDEAEKEAIRAASEKTAIFNSGNMSVGIATLCDAVKRVVAAFPDADVEIVETHHNRKVDAPSGTALMLFDAVKEVRPEAEALCGRSGHGKRTYNEVGISALRMGNIVGIHEVAICTDNERITLKHEAFDRALFADGAVKAAEYLVGKPAGFYNMKHMFQ